MARFAVRCRALPLAAARQPAGRAARRKVRRMLKQLARRQAATRGREAPRGPRGRLHDPSAHPRRQAMDAAPPRHRTHERIVIVRVERKWLTQAYVWADVEVAVGRGVDSRSCGEERVSTSGE